MENLVQRIVALQCERESYYSLGTNVLNFKTTFTQEQYMSEGNWMHGITANVEP